MSFGAGGLLDSPTNGQTKFMANHPCMATWFPKMGVPLNHPIGSSIITFRFWRSLISGNLRMDRKDYSVKKRVVLSTSYRSFLLSVVLPVLGFFYIFKHVHMICGGEPARNPMSSSVPKNTSSDNETWEFPRQYR